MSTVVMANLPREAPTHEHELAEHLSGADDVVRFRSHRAVHHDAARSLSHQIHVAELRRLALPDEDVAGLGVRLLEIIDESGDGSGRQIGEQQVFAQAVLNEVPFLVAESGRHHFRVE